SQDTFSSPLDTPGSALSLSSSSYPPTFGPVVAPTIQGYEDAGDFTMTERLKTSIHANLVFYVCIGAIGLFGLILLILLRRNWFASYLANLLLYYRSGGILGLAMACSNTFGLVTGAFLLGFGLSEIPKGIWKNADWTARQKVLTHKVAKMAVELDDAHQEFSNAIVVAQATSKQMSKRDTLRPYMNIIDDMLFQMVKEDPSFKPQGGRLGENDMDYDTDEKSMATLRRQLRRAREEYYRYRREYTKFVLEALELEDTVKNNERRDVTGWKYISSFRPERSGTLGSFLDMIGSCFRSSDVYVHMHILFLVQNWNADVLLTDTQANKLGQLAYDLLELVIRSHFHISARMVARYAPPISYNFLNLIRLDGDEKTIFEQEMGNIDDAVPFFGKGFNKIYPLIMVIYTILIASSFFHRVIEYFGNWKIFKFQNESDDMDGFDQSGVIILKKGRSGLEQGHKVGEHVIPLARNFNNVTIDIEPGSNSVEKVDTELKSTKVIEDGKRGQLQSLKEEALIDTSREAISNMDLVEKNVTSSTADSSNLQNVTAGSSSRFASKWEAMKTGFQNLKSNIVAKRFIPLRQSQETKIDHVSSSESLDEIFERLKQPTMNRRGYYNDDNDYDHGLDIREMRSSR
ncbi:lmbr1 domain-containing protein 2 like protein a, partial [Quercus suber]